MPYKPNWSSLPPKRNDTCKYFEKRYKKNGKEEMTRGRTVNKQLALAPTQKLIKRNSDK